MSTDEADDMAKTQAKAETPVEAQAERPRGTGVWTEADARELARLESLAGTPAAFIVGPMARETDDVLARLRARHGVSDDPSTWATPKAQSEDEIARERERKNREEAAKRLRTAKVPADPLVPLLAAMPGGSEVLTDPERRLWREEFGALSRLEPTDALRITRAWLKGGVVLDGAFAEETFTGSGWALVMGGSIGCGKTLAAGWALREFSTAPGKRSLWVPARNLARLKSDDLFDEAVSVELLVLDEIGFEYSGQSGWGVDRIEALLWERAQAWRRTICTSNMSRESFRERYGARIDSRLNRGGAYFEIVGPDLRDQKGRR